MAAESMLTSPLKRTRLNGNQPMMVPGRPIWKISVDNREFGGRESFVHDPQHRHKHGKQTAKGLNPCDSPKLHRINKL